MSAPDGAIRAWCLDLVDTVSALSTATSSRYGDAARLEHYIQTAELFERHLPDHRALQQAAFLHGVWDVSLLDELDTPLEPAVKEILAEWKVLRAIVKPGDDVPVRLPVEVLPQLRNAESALLLVVEQLKHVDPQEQFADFAEAFYTCPRELRTPSPLPPLGFDRLSAQYDFLRLVVVPTAEFFGLWFFRNLSEDLYLYHTDEARFRDLCRFALEEVKDEPARRASIVRRLIEDLPGVDVFWQWHHIASLDRRLPRMPRDSTKRWFPNCGMVTVVCETPEDCYRVLARLHLDSSCRHQTRDLEDSIGNPTASGYEAIHTTLMPAGRSGLPSVRVRITHRAARETSLRRLSRRTLEVVQRQIDATAKNQIRVLANDGRVVSLPAGSTALNFAHAIHGDFVALAVRAFVNGDARDLLHPLKTGDVVRLEVGTEPRALPPGWDKKVPQDTIQSIRKVHSRHYRPRDVKLGREIVRGRLEKLGVHDIRVPEVYGESVVDSFLEEAIETIVQRRNQTSPLRDLGSWLRQFSLHDDGRVHGNEAAILEEILAETAVRMKDTVKVGVEELAVPENMRGTFDRWSLCEHCHPGENQSVVGRVDDRMLTIHMAGYPCAIQCKPIAWKRRYTRGQYFVVEMANRQGIAAAVISTFAALGVQILDLVSATLGPHWGVLRVHVQSLGPQLVAKLREELVKIPGVLRVVLPDEAIVPVLEGVLPPRERSRPLFFGHHSPFQCGPPLQEDQYFYGRGYELAVLRRLFQQTQSPQASHGLMAWVKGPYKTGKTSLVERFVRELRRTEYRCRVVNVTANIHADWHAVELDLRRQVLEMLSESRIARRESAPNDEDSRLPLAQLIGRFRATTNQSLVLVIDEAVSMFLNTRNERELLEFFGAISASPGVLVVWVGPEAPAMQLSEPLRTALRAVEQIKVRGLKLSSIKHLLRADNLRDGGLSIKVDDQLAREVFLYTRGNPYWCNLLAHTLFVGQERLDGQVYFSLAALKRAKHALRENSHAFSDRVEELADEELHGAARVLLGTLVRQHHRSRQGLAFEPLLDAARQAGLRLNAQQLDRALHELRVRGAIRKTSDRLAPWKIDCPALTDHIARAHLHVWNRL